MDLGECKPNSVCYLYGDYLELYTLDKVESLISGENVLDRPSILFIASVIMTIPPLMIFLSLVLKPRINKWLNIIVESLFTVMMVLIAVLPCSESHVRDSEVS